jgi:hypothetical protein
MKSSTKPIEKGLLCPCHIQAAAYWHWTGFAYCSALSCTVFVNLEVQMECSSLVVGSVDDSNGHVHDVML